MKASEADNTPEFSAEILPPGSAPAQNTFRPNTVSEVPGQADNEDTLRSQDKESTYTSASDTLGGATSGDVYTGYGHPGQGQTSSELRHDGEHHRKRQGGGLESVGVSSGRGIASERVDERQRGLEHDYPGGSKGSAEAERGNKVFEGTEVRLPESAEGVASERA